MGDVLLLPLPFVPGPLWAAPLPFTIKGAARVPAAATAAAFIAAAVAAAVVDLGVTMRGIGGATPPPPAADEVFGFPAGPGRIMPDWLLLPVAPDDAPTPNAAAAAAALPPLPPTPPPKLAETLWLGLSLWAALAHDRYVTPGSVLAPDTSFTP